MYNRVLFEIVFQIKYYDYYEVFKLPIFSIPNTFVLDNLKKIVCQKI